MKIECTVLAKALGQRVTELWTFLRDVPQSANCYRCRSKRISHLTLNQIAERHQVSIDFVEMAMRRLRAAGLVSVSTSGQGMVSRFIYGHFCLDDFTGTGPDRFDVPRETVRWVKSKPSHGGKRKGAGRKSLAWKR